MSNYNLHFQFYAIALYQYVIFVDFFISAKNGQLQEIPVACIWHFVIWLQTPERLSGNLSFMQYCSWPYYKNNGISVNPWSSWLSMKCQGCRKISMHLWTPKHTTVQYTILKVVFWKLIQVKHKKRGDEIIFVQMQGQNK